MQENNHKHHMLFWLVMCFVVGSVGCSSIGARHHEHNSHVNISRDIAETMAKSIFRECFFNENLADYRVTMKDAGVYWEIEFELLTPGGPGSGLIMEINKMTGEVLVNYNQ